MTYPQNLSQTHLWKPGETGVGRMRAGTACVGACMGHVDSSIARMLLLRLNLEFGTLISAAGPTL